MPTELTDANFSEEVLSGAEAVLVDFWAPWCGPCRMMGPVIENLAHEMDGKNVKIAKLNVDEHTKTAEQFGVMSIPTFIVFKDGKQVAQSSGVQTLDELKALIAQAM